MTNFALAIGSMLALTALAWLAGKHSRLRVCPICVGVSGTWLWLLAARLNGFEVDTALLAMFLGASVVGGAHSIEKRLPQQRSTLLWKSAVLPTGFAGAYGLVQELWILAAAAAAALALLTAFFLRPWHEAAGDPEMVTRLEERMKKCC
jgi:hypothetical protein